MGLGLGAADRRKPRARPRRALGRAAAASTKGWYGAADAGPLPPGPRGSRTAKTRPHAPSHTATRAADRRRRRAPRDLVRHGLRPGRDPRDLAGVARPFEPPLAGRPADPADRCAAQRPPDPAPGRPEPRDRDWIPLV